MKSRGKGSKSLGIFLSGILVLLMGEMQALAASTTWLERNDSFLKLFAAAVFALSLLGVLYYLVRSRRKGKTGEDTTPE